MGLEKPSSWKCYYVLENQSSPGGMVSNPSLTYIGHITEGSPDPNAKYKKVKSSGQLDYRKLHKLSQKPRSRIQIELATVNYIKDVIDDKYHSLVFRNPVDDQTIRYLGAKVDVLDLSCDMDDSAMATIDLESWKIDRTAVTLGSGSYGADSSLYLDYSNVEISKNASVIDGWLSCGIRIDNSLKRRLKASDRSTRNLERVERDNSFNYKLDIDAATAFEELDAILNDTSFTFKFKMTNPDSSASWSTNFANAKFDGDGFKGNLFNPTDVLGKELSGSGETISYGT